MTVEEIRGRLVELREEHNRLRELLRVVNNATEADRDQRTPVTDRLLAFMRRHPAIEFSPELLMHAIHAREDSCRKSLTRLKERGLAVNPRWGFWRAMEVA